MLAASGPQEERVRPDTGRARLARRADDLGDLVGAVALLVRRNGYCVFWRNGSPRPSAGLLAPVDPPDSGSVVGGKPREAARHHAIDSSARREETPRWNPRWRGVRSASRSHSQTKNDLGGEGEDAA